ncbi:unnamed protein product [Dicrocoelium dendriticum]|nr:unnamed protein product [Dicrocoelium dendriticum]
MAVSLNTEADGHMGSSFDESTSARGQVNCSEPVTDLSGGMQWTSAAAGITKAVPAYKQTSTKCYHPACTSILAVLNAVLRDRRARLSPVLNLQRWLQGGIAGYPHKPIKVKKNMVRKQQKPSAKPRELVATASEKMPTLTVVKTSDDCTQENLPKMLTVSAAIEPACSDEMLATAQCDTKSTAPAPVNQKKKRTRSARKTSMGLEDTGISNTPAIERKSAAVASTSFLKTETVPLPVVKTASISVESKARGVNTPRRADSFTDGSVRFRNVTQAAAALAKERFLNDTKWLKITHPGGARPRDARADFLEVVPSSVRSLRSKVHELGLLVGKSRPDILAFTATWLSPDSTDGEVCLPGYELLSTDCSAGRQGRAVVLYVTRNLDVLRTSTVRSAAQTVKTLSAGLCTSSTQFTVIVIYRGPEISSREILEFNRTPIAHKRLVLTDFNLTEVYWTQPTCNSASGTFGADFLELSPDVPSHQAVDLSTRSMDNQIPCTLDLVFAKSLYLVTDIPCRALLWFSKHACMFFRCALKRHQPNTVELLPNIRRADFSSMRAKASFLNCEISMADSVHLGLDQFKAYIAEFLLPISHP